MTQSLVSVIIPTYNGAKRIAKTLEAIINQDYENIEIILVDDVSTDDTVKISQDILEKSGRKFLIIKRTVNGRQSASRNTGLKAANGKYVIFVDHDDLMAENFVSTLCTKAEQENADIVFCIFSSYIEKENRFVSEHFDIESGFSSPDYYLKAWASEKIDFLGCWNFLFRKNFLYENNLRFNEKCIYGEDGEFLMKAIISASKILFEKKPLYFYIIHGENTVLQHEKRKSETHKHLRLSRIRRGFYVAKHTKDRQVKNYALSFSVAYECLKLCTLLAQYGDYEFYNYITKKFRHKKVRKVMLSTVNYILQKPALFFKCLILTYFPKFYYWNRAKIWK